MANTIIYPLSDPPLPDATFGMCDKRVRCPRCAAIAAVVLLARSDYRYTNQCPGFGKRPVLRVKVALPFRRCTQCGCKWPDEFADEVALEQVRRFVIAAVRKVGCTCAVPIIQWREGWGPTCQACKLTAIVWYAKA